MSIALLHQIYDETRRLAVAGSATAPGDFRLKKLIDPLKQAGTKAPVFAKLAESANAIINANEQTAPDALLELLGLATAIRYTQGETGLPGKLEPLGVKIPLARPTELGARVLQPLLQALRTTGSGRFEVVQDADTRGVFKDLRLILPAIAGLDDPYPEIAELMAKTIIPESFGPAIAPYVKAGYDPKGNKGSARRLQLLHRFDAAGTRELVMQALENGSKEVRVAALSCLGMHSDDVHILIEQSFAKAQDVRIASYYGLSQMESEEAINSLRKTMAGKELVHAWRPLAASKGPRLLHAILAEFKKELAELMALKDKKEISAKIERLGFFLHTLHERTDKDAEAMVLELFAQRDKLAKVKGDTLSGSDLNLDVVRAMAGGTKAMANKLVESHATLENESLPYAFDAAHAHLSADRVFEIFSPYLTPLIGGKKSDATTVKKYAAVVDQINSTGRGYHSILTKQRPLDPRWLDLAVRLPHFDLLRTLARPGHAQLNEFLAEGFRKQVASAKKTDELRFYCETMAAVKHAEFEASFFAAVETIKAKTDPSAVYYYSALIPSLPKSAIPALEALVPKLGDRYSDHWVRRIEELRAQPDGVV